MNREGRGEGHEQGREGEGHEQGGEEDMNRGEGGHEQGVEGRRT